MYINWDDPRRVWTEFAKELEEGDVLGNGRESIFDAASLTAEEYDTADFLSEFLAGPRGYRRSAWAKLPATDRLPERWVPNFSEFNRALAASYDEAYAEITPVLRQYMKGLYPETDDESASSSTWGQVAVSGQASELGGFQPYYVQETRQAPYTGEDALPYLGFSYPGRGQRDYNDNIDDFMDASEEYKWRNPIGRNVPRNPSIIEQRRWSPEYREAYQAQQLRMAAVRSTLGPYEGPKEIAVPMSDLGLSGREPVYQRGKGNQRGAGFQFRDALGRWSRSVSSGVLYDGGDITAAVKNLALENYDRLGIQDRSGTLRRAVTDGQVKLQVEESGKFTIIFDLADYRRKRRQNEPTDVPVRQYGLYVFYGRPSIRPKNQRYLRFPNDAGKWVATRNVIATVAKNPFEFDDPQKEVIGNAIAVDLVNQIQKAASE